MVLNIPPTFLICTTVSILWQHAILSHIQIYVLLSIILIHSVCVVCVYLILLTDNIHTHSNIVLQCSAHLSSQVSQLDESYFSDYESKVYGPTLGATL